MGSGPWLPASPPGRMNFGEFFFRDCLKVVLGCGSLCCTDEQEIPYGFSDAEWECSNLPPGP